MEIPKASAPESVPVTENEFISLIRADIRETKAVRRTVSIPKWMDDEVSDAGLSLSRVLQEALNARFGAIV